MPTFTSSVEDETEEKTHSNNTGGAAPHVSFNKDKKEQNIETFEMLLEDDIDKLPDPECLIEDFLELATVSLWYGESGSRKTFVGIHTAECVARGMDWFSHAVKKGVVLYVYAEGKGGMKRRLKAWRKYHKVQSTPNLHVIAMPVHLITDRQKLTATIKKVADDTAMPVLIVIDTFSNCASGLNQDKQHEVEPALATAHNLTREYGCATMIIHHTNKSDKFNGSQAFRNHVDAMIEVSKDEQAATILHSVKARDLEPFSDIRLSAEIVEAYINEKTGKPVTSLVLKPAPTLYVVHQSKEDKLSPRQEQVLQSFGSEEKLYHTEWEERAKSLYGISSSTFGQALQALKKKGFVEVHKETAMYQRTSKGTEYEAA
jgi:hypothetical protein